MSAIGLIGAGSFLLGYYFTESAGHSGPRELMIYAGFFLAALDALRQRS